MTINATWQGATEFVAFMRSLAGNAAPRAQLKMGRVAIAMQKRIKENVAKAVYEQPAAPSGYIRTGTLFRSIHAAPPDADHSDDEVAAHGEQDLSTEEPSRAAGETHNGKIGSEIGSHISYSEIVQEGANGVPPRPYITDADVDEAERLLAKEFESMLGGG